MAVGTAGSARRLRNAGPGPGKAIRGRSQAKPGPQPSPPTDESKLLAALQASEQRFWVALAAAPIVVFNQDRNLRYTWIGKPALGLKEEEAIGRNDEEIMGPTEAQELTTIKRRVLETGRGERREVLVSHAGRSGWFDLTVEPMRDPAGQIVGITCAAVDVTQHKRVENERAAALERLANAAELERQRIARELHDQTAQRLVALAVELKTLETNLAAGRPQARRVRSLRRAVDDLQQQVRQIAWDLRAGEPAEGGLENALRAYVEEWSERTQVATDCECRGGNGTPLPASIEATLYRLVQETLAKIGQHARARHVSVLLERDENLVRLTVEDDGCGFDADSLRASPELPQRLGLLGMRERVALAGGTLLVESSPGTGTTILARIPLPPASKPS